MSQDHDGERGRLMKALAESEERFGTTKLAIGGASAGANLALATLFRLRGRGLLDRFEQDVAGCLGESVGVFDQ